MARVINLDKGNKRKVRLVRWRPSELVSFFLVLLVLVMWLMTHSFD